MSRTDAAGGSPADPAQPLVVLHVGDLHLTRRRARNACDLRAILAQIDGIAPQGAFDFVYLPGDLAEDGYRVQYLILEDALAAHPGLPVRLIPGDHDRQYGSMERFDDFFRRVAGSLRGGGVEPVVNRLPRPRAMKPVTQYYYAETIAGVRCLFVDMISAGYGEKGIGLDFRLGRVQRQWLVDEVTRTSREGTRCAVFMHSYPRDIRPDDEQEDVAGLFWSERVRLVEMGHTHYNELAHDGRTLYGSARSVGQNEDGSAGYAVAVLDRGVASWRYRPLDKPWPFVTITSPSDVRLATAPLIPGGNGMVEVRALVLSDQPPEACACVCRVDDGPWKPMAREPGQRCFTVAMPWLAGAAAISVRATDGRWHGIGHRYVDTDTIVPAPRDFVPPPKPALPGSDAFHLGAWPEKGLRGDQLGPNRNGRPW